MSETPLLEVSNLTKLFPAGGILFKKRYVRAVDDVSFIMPGNKPIITNLVGESGSGKTTIAKMMMGLLKPTAGEIKYRGQNIHKMSKQERITYRKEVQAVFQDPYAIYNPFYKIDRVLKLPIKKFKLASTKSEARKMILEALHTIGLRPEDVLGRYPHQLSGGERQRIMLARLHLIKPKIVIADEPISMIDVSLRVIFLNVLLEFQKKYGVSCLFITHNLTSPYYMGGDIIVLCRGRIIERGNVDSVIEKPAHPYTNMLINSLPARNPRRRWKEKLELKATGIAESAQAGHGCPFYHRCPGATEKCAKLMPQLTTLDENHQVACHLYLR